jgi:DNA-binding MarR family transcriptional regulator
MRLRNFACPAEAAPYKGIGVFEGEMDERSSTTLVAMRRILRATELGARALARETGLTTAQLLVLQAIAQADAGTPTAIASETGVSQATITALIDKLETKGFVVRRKSDRDRRQTLVLLTDAGRKALAEAPDPLQDQFVTRFEQLPDWERSMILAALERVASLMDAEALEASPVLVTGAIDAAPHQG